MKKVKNVRPYPVSGPGGTEVGPGKIISVPDWFVPSTALVLGEESASSKKKTTKKKTRKKPLHIKK